MKRRFIGILLICCLGPARVAIGAAGQSDLLGEEYRSPANGIALRPPSECSQIITSDPSQVVEFDDPANHWALRVRRISFAHPVPLEDYKDQFGQDRDGFLRTTAKQLKEQQLAEVVTQDIIHVGPHGQTAVGILVLRRAEDFQHRLVQQAMVQANDQLYYVIELDTPARVDADTGAEDPGERHAADAFNQVIDSVELLDRAAIFRDQAERLIRFRGLLANWTPSFLASRLLPEQFFRLVRDGKDIGYTYEIDEIDDKSGSVAGTAVIKISVRSESEPTEGTDIQAQSRLQVTVDRKHENWMSLAVVIAPPAQASAGSPPNVSQLSELGVSDQKLRPVPLVLPGAGLDAGAAAADADAIQPGVRMKESWRLTVIRKGGDAKEFKQDFPRFEQDVPSYYIPQALSYLLPRLVPWKEPKTYLCAVYVPDGDHGQPAVMMRYLDVLPAAEVTLDGQKIVAVPVKDRIGLEGVATTHYLNPDDGSYLGSVTTTTQGQDQVPTTAVVLPTDAATLRRIWPHCILTRPDRIVDDVGKNP
jgi:hypothetical protein